MTEDLDKPDGGWRAWIIVFASFMVSFLQDGIAYSFGVLLPPLADHYQVGRAVTSFVISIMTFLNFVTGLLGAYLVKRIGYMYTNLLGAIFSIIGLIASGLVVDFCPQESIYIFALYVTLGGMVGIGFGLMYFPAMDIIPLYFSKKLGIANGLATAGSGAGQMVLAHVFQQLMTHLGLSKSFYVLSGVVVPAIFFGFLYKDPLVQKNEESKSPEQQILTNKETDEQTIQQENKAKCKLPSISKSMFILLPHYFLMNAGIFAALSLTNDRAIHRGLSGDDSSWLLSVMGISNCFGRILFGKVIDIFRPKLISITTVVMIILALSVIISEYLTSFETLIVYCVIFGATFGAHVSSASVMLQTYMFKNQRITDSLALTFLTVGLSSMVGPALVGELFDTSNSYSFGFIVIGSCQLIGALLLAAFFWNEEYWKSPVEWKCFKGNHTEGSTHEMSEVQGGNAGSGWGGPVRI